MFQESSDGFSTPEEPAPSAGGLSPDDKSNQDESTTTAQIKLLRKMCSEGHIGKKDLAKMIMQILSRPVVTNATTSQKRPRDEDNHDARHLEQAEKVLRTTKRFRRAASPATVKIRKLIEGPIERRFQLECSKKNSVLFGSVPPRRLQEDIFQVACQSPLQEIYTSHAKELQDVASPKVMHIVKWKIRKMRANPMPAKHHVGDGYDFDAVARALESKLFNSPAERRRNYFYKRSKTRCVRTSHTSHTSFTHIKH